MRRVITCVFAFMLAVVANQLPALSAAVPEAGSAQIVGVSAVGQQLDASTGTWTAGTSFSFQWFRDGQIVSGATSSSYIPSPGDAFSKVQLRVTGSLDGYDPVSKYSPIKFISAQQSDLGTPGRSFAARIANGAGFNCGLQVDGSIQCLGRNNLGQLGDGTTTNTTTPVQVTGITNAIDLDAGFAHVCALTSQGTIYCWGDAGYGQLGNGSTVDRTTPVQVTGITNAISISLGKNHSCALLEDRTAKCWGDGSDSQLGNGSTSNSSIPVSVTGLSDITEISPGSVSTCALTLSGAVYCWGWRYQANVGYAVTYNTTATLMPNATSGIVDIADKCFLVSDGSVKCWYATSSSGSYQAVAVENVANATKLFAGGGYRTCALISDGAINCWTNTTNAYSLSGFTDVVDFDLFYAGTADSGYVALTSGRAVYGLGSNLYGEYGDGPGTQVTTPLEILGYGLSLQTIGTPTITGTAQVGQTLTANEGTWDAGVSFEYQWFRDGQVISGATGQTYTLSPVDLGTSLSVRVSGRKLGWPAVTTVSTGTTQTAAAPVITTPSQGGGFFGPIIATPTPISTNPIPAGQKLGAVDADGNAIEIKPALAQDKKSIELSFGTAKLSLAAPTGASFSDDGKLSVSPAAPMTISATGYQPDSTVSGFLVPTSSLVAAAFSIAADPTIELGTTTVLQDGSFNFSTKFDAQPGSYLLQLTGTTSDGKQTTIALETLVASLDQSMKTWAKRLPGNTEAKLYAKNIIGVGKVSLRVNGKEIAWVRAIDATDPKLRVVTEGPMAGANYLVRTVKLQKGKNILEVYVDGVRTTRTAYTK